MKAIILYLAAIAVGAWLGAQALKPATQAYAAIFAPVVEALK